MYDETTFRREHRDEEHQKYPEWVCQKVGTVYKNWKNAFQLLLYPFNTLFYLLVLFC